MERTLRLIYIKQKIRYIEAFGEHGIYDVHAAMQPTSMTWPDVKRALTTVIITDWLAVPAFQENT